MQQILQAEQCHLRTVYIKHSKTYGDEQVVDSVTVTTEGTLEINISADLEKDYSIIHIAGREYQVRYSLNTLFCLEKCHKPIGEILKIPLTKWDIECILQLVKAGICDNPKNRKQVIKRDWNNIKPNIEELGRKIDIKDFRTLKREIIDALINYLPQAVYGARKSDEDVNYIAVRSIYCDVMGRPEKEFWTSNLKEIQQRTEKYFEVKGLKKPV